MQLVNYKFSTDNDQDNQGDQGEQDTTSSSDKELKVFRVHSAILSKRSDYFTALLDSKMMESQNRSLTLTDADISYNSLETILKYLYTGTLPNFKTYDEWISLLHNASRFLIPTLREH